MSEPAPIHKSLAQRIQEAGLCGHEKHDIGVNCYMNMMEYGKRYILERYCRSCHVAIRMKIESGVIVRGPYVVGAGAGALKTRPGITTACQTERIDPTSG
jgi:hypothetical protein